MVEEIYCTRPPPSRLICEADNYFCPRPAKSPLSWPLWAYTCFLSLLGTDSAVYQKHSSQIFFLTPDIHPTVHSISKRLLNHGHC